MKNSNIKSCLILCTAALVWGLGFVAQSGAVEHIPSFTVNALRSFIAAAALWLLYKFTSRGSKNGFFPKQKAGRKKYIASAVICGTALTVATNFQMFGIAAYPSGAPAEARSGFITALYVVIVPVMALFFGKKSGVFIWLSVAVAVFGFWLLCLSDGINAIYLGDILVLISAFFFSVQILAVDKFVGEIGGIKLSVMQFIVVGVISAVCALMFEKPELGGIVSAVPQILYLGIVSSGVGYTLQIVGQEHADPAVASLSLSLESVFAALGGWLISGNTLSLREFVGCAVVFSAIIIAQIPEMKRKNAGT